MNHHYQNNYDLSGCTDLPSCEPTPHSDHWNWSDLCGSALLTARRNRCCWNPRLDHTETFIYHPHWLCVTCRSWSQTPSRNVHNTTDIIHTLTAHAEHTERYTTLQISFTHSQPHWLTGCKTPTYLLTHTHSSRRTDRNIHSTTDTTYTSCRTDRNIHSTDTTHTSCRTDRNIHSTTDTTHTSCRTDGNIHSTDTTHTSERWRGDGGRGGDGGGRRWL